MILRRFMEHASDQNWFAVGLDSLVVIISIIIGLQVSNWNDERQAKETVNDYYHLLIDELDVNIDHFNEAIQYYGVVKNYADLVSKEINKSENELGSKFIVNVYQATQLYGPAIPRDTVKELLNSQEFIKFSDRKLKKMIAAYASGLNENRALSAPITNYRKNIRGLLDNRVQQMINTTCGDVIKPITSEGISNYLPIGCELVLNEKLSLKQIKRLRLYKNLEFDLTYRVSDIDWKIYNYTIFKQFAEDIISRVRDVQADI